MSHRPLLIVLLAFLLCGGSALDVAGDEVVVRHEAVTLPWFTSTQVWTHDQDTSKAHQPLWGSRQRAGKRTFDAIVLENRYLTVQVLPEVAGTVHRVIDRTTGEDLFFNEESAKDWVPFWESGVKVSFPFREHGTGPDQPAATRIVHHDDGSVSIAMWMEFSRNHEYHQRWSYGRFGTMFLQQTVTLGPDRAVVSIDYRVLNASAYQQGKQLWNDALLPRYHDEKGVVHGRRRPGRDDAELIYPTRWVSSHNGDQLRRWTLDDRRVGDYTDNNISLFAWDPAAPFVGIWYPRAAAGGKAEAEGEGDERRAGVNRLRLFDPEEAPGAKFYWRGSPWQPGRLDTHMFSFIELWGGTHHVFEGVEDWVQPGESYGFTHRFTMTHGIGRASWATPEAVVSLSDAGDALELVTLRPREGMTLVVDGKEAKADVASAPDRAVRVAVEVSDTPRRFQVKAGDGAVLLDATLPTDWTAGGDEMAMEPDASSPTPHRRREEEGERARHERLVDVLRLDNPESRERSGDAEAWGRAWWNAKYPEAAKLERGRLAYRAGDLDKARLLLREAVEADEQNGSAWRLLGVTLLEAGEPQEAKATLERALDAEANAPAAGYWLAIIALGDGDAKRAIERLVALHEARPGHVEGELLRAWVLNESKEEAERREGATLAATLERDWPADPRVVWVRAQTAGDDAAGDSAATVLEDLLKQEPGARARLEAFQAATRGQWHPPARLDMTPPERPADDGDGERK